MNGTLRWSLLSGFFLALAAVGGCDGEMGDLSRTIKISPSPFVITVELNDYEYKQIAGEEYTFVKGALTVKNEGAVADVVDLNALCLSLGSIVSKGANIDSVAYFLPKMDVAPSQIVSRKVYWVFDGQLKLSATEGAELLYKQANCGPQ